MSSDPLGLAAGMNTYAYAANDPINHIDPSGLLLFAFDGTDNSDIDPVNERTNVVQFRDAYRGHDDELNTRQGKEGEVTHWYYITGAGRNDARSGLDAGVGWDGANLDLADGNRTGERVIQMAKYLYKYLGRLQEAERNGQKIQDTLNIDIVGFSRGASEARIFANLIERFLAGDNTFVVTQGDGSDTDSIDFNTVGAEARAYLANSCLNVNLRFMGLWDTVSHIGIVEYDDAIESYGEGDQVPAYRPYQTGPGYTGSPGGNAYLGIPASVDFTAHAVAVNERRGVFDTWSIYESPGQAGGNKIEKGFIGAHADIGGGYPESDLSDVAFMWMVQQAIENGGLPEGAIDMEYISESRFNVVTEPIANDPVYNAPSIIPDDLYYPGRYFRYLDAGEATDVLQKDDTVAEGAEDLDFDSALAFLEENIYQDTGSGQIFGNDGLSDTVLKQGDNGQFPYQAWLLDNYGLDININDSGVEVP